MAEAAHGGASARRDGDGLESLAAAVAGAGGRVCRWPACGRPARHLEERDGGRARRPGRAGAPAAVGGRRPRFCSDGHQRANADTVRRLRSLRGQAADAAAGASGRARRKATALLAEIDHRLALHGEPPAADVGAGGAGLLLRPRSEAGGRLTVSVRSSAAPWPARGPVPRPAAPERTAAARAAGTGSGATVIDFPTRALAPAGPVVQEPVLALRRPGERQLFEQAWDRLRDANDACRTVLGALRRARDDTARSRLVADAAADLVELAEAVDQVTLDVVRIPPAGRTAAPERPANRNGLRAV